MDPRIAEEVKAHFCQIMNVDAEGLDFDARLDDVYGVTSVNLMRLVSDLEVALGIEIPEAEGKRVCNLGAMVRLCEQYSQPEGLAAAGRG